MARKALPEVEKLKTRIIELSEEEAKELFDWLELLLDVREAETRRKAASG